MRRHTGLPYFIITISYLYLPSKLKKNMANSQRFKIFWKRGVGGITFFLKKVFPHASIFFSFFFLFQSTSSRSIFAYIIKALLTY